MDTKVQGCLPTTAEQDAIRLLALKHILGILRRDW